MIKALSKKPWVSQNIFFLFCSTEKTTKEFSHKMGTLMQYIENTYLNENLKEPMSQKLRQSPITEDEKNIMDMGFDAIFSVEETDKK